MNRSLTRSCLQVREILETILRKGSIQGYPWNLLRSMTNQDPTRYRIMFSPVKSVLLVHFYFVYVVGACLVRSCARRILLFKTHVSTLVLLFHVSSPLHEAGRGGFILERCLLYVNGVKYIWTKLLHFCYLMRNRLHWSKPLQKYNWGLKGLTQRHSNLGDRIKTSPTQLKTSNLNSIRFKRYWWVLFRIFGELDFKNR